MVDYIYNLSPLYPPINAWEHKSDFKKGSVQVQALQETLAQLGYTITVDGIFGEETERVVKELQTTKDSKRWDCRTKPIKF